MGQHTCIDCGSTSPDTQTEYTLIGQKFGWRLQKGVAPDGTPRIEWRCPDCFKKRKGGAAGPPSVQFRAGSPASGEMPAGAPAGDKAKASAS